MKRFCILGHRAVTNGEFPLNDMPGSAGRIDVLCRCVNSCFFLSHEFRRDVECYLVLMGEPEAPKTVMFRGSELKYLNPDERSAGSLLKKALALPCTEEFTKSTPGVFVRTGGLERLLEEIPFAVLDENGEDIRACTDLPDDLLLCDHMNFTPEEEALLADAKRISVGPMVLHADHTITVVLNEQDRREGSATVTNEEAL